MVRTRKQAFTLSELMVVVGLIGLLVAFLTPFVTGAYDVQRRVYCANNLEKLGQAYATRASEGSATTAAGWTAGLSPYVGGSRSVFFCPKDPNPQVDNGELLNNIFLECYASGGINDASRVTWRVYFNEGGITSHDYAPWVWKLSSAQYAMRPALVAQFKTQVPRRGIPYQSDGNPNTWYIVWEDQGYKPGAGDEDFYDLNAKIELVGNDVYITPVDNSSGYNFSLAMTSDGQRTAIMGDMKQYTNVRTRIAGLSGGSSTSYGINSVVDKLMPMSRKALILDYGHTIALGSGYEENFSLGEQQNQLAAWQGDPNRPGQPVIWARHFKQINALFADGSVVLTAPQQINPNFLNVRTKYWDP
jgi:prepilin-type N-terminal cleavage/methylation domain-containing protein/prepilin-type processing-associated H-X9-DG protein